MSFIFAPNEVFQDPRLSKPELRTLLGLFSFRGKNTDTVWPSRETLADRIGYSKETVSRAITGLVEKGWVDRNQHRGPSTYKLHVPEFLCDPCPVSINSDQGSHSINGLSSDQGGHSIGINSDQGGHSTVTKVVTPEHTNEHNSTYAQPSSQASRISPSCEADFEINAHPGDRGDEETQNGGAAAGGGSALGSPPDARVRESGEEKREDPDGFDTFWNLWPKKVDKKESRAIWCGMSVAERHMALQHVMLLPYQDIEKRYIPSPAAYLRKEKYEDEIIRSKPISPARRRRL